MWSGVQHDNSSSQTVVCNFTEHLLGRAPITCAQVIPLCGSAQACGAQACPFRSYMESVARGKVSQEGLLLACISDTLGQIMLGMGCLCFSSWAFRWLQAKVFPTPPGEDAVLSAVAGTSFLSSLCFLYAAIEDISWQSSGKYQAEDHDRAAAIGPNSMAYLHAFATPSFYQGIMRKLCCIQLSCMEPLRQRWPEKLRLRYHLSSTAREFVASEQSKWPNRHHLLQETWGVLQHCCACVLGSWSISRWAQFELSQQLFRIRTFQQSSLIYWNSPRIASC